MTSGHTAPVYTYIPRRVSLRADELDPCVFYGMADEEVDHEL